MRTLDQPRRVLRRQPVRIVAGEPEGGYTNAFEIICCDCGDDPGLDYRDVSAELQRVRGPYPIAAGVRAYEEHVAQHQQLKRSLRIRSARRLFAPRLLARLGQLQNAVAYPRQMGSQRA